MSDPLDDNPDPYEENPDPVNPPAEPSPGIDRWYKRNLTEALMLDAAGNVALRTGMTGNITISGPVTIPGTVTVQSTPEVPIHNHITEVGTSGMLDVPYLPIGGNVNANVTGGNIRVTALPAITGTVTVSSGNINAAVTGTVAVSSLPDITGTVAVSGITGNIAGITALPPITGNVNANITGGNVNAAVTGNIAGITALPPITGNVNANITGGNVNAAVTGNIAGITALPPITGNVNAAVTGTVAVSGITGNIAGITALPAITGNVNANITGGNVNAAVTGTVAVSGITGNISGITGNVTVVDGGGSLTIDGTVGVTGNIAGITSLPAITGNVNAAVTGTVTVSSVTGNIAGITALPPITGNINANITGGNVNAAVTGTVTVSSVTGNIAGITALPPITGNINANITGGNVNAVVTGSVAVSAVTGNIAGITALPPITGNINANITGGNVNAVVTGSVAAVVTGNVGVTGNIAGITALPPITGNVNANITGGNVTVAQGTSPWLVTGNLTSTTSFGSGSTDAFGRLRVSEPYTLFDTKVRYYDHGQFSSQTTGGNVQFDSNSSSFTMNINGTSGSTVVRESKRIFAYQPGKSLLVLNTFAMNTPKTGLRQRVGYFGEQNGVFFENDGTFNYLVIRSYSTGALTEERVRQDAWNGDRLNGLGGSNNPSLITLYPDRVQILQIDVQWLGVGSVRCGFVIDGNYYQCHTFHHANVAGQTTTYMTTASLPLRYEITNTSATGSNSTMRQICSSVVSEGGYNSFAPTECFGTGVTALRLVTAGTYYPIVSIRLAPTRLDTIVLPRQVDVLSTTVNYYRFLLILNPTLTGATWAGTSQSGTVQFDTAATSFTGGTQLQSFYAASREVVELGGIDYFQFQLGRTLAGVSDIVTLVASATSNNADVMAQLGIQEIL